MNSISKAFNETFEVIAFSVSNNETLEKIAKISSKVIQAVELVFGQLSVATSNFAKALGNAIVVFETLRFVGVMKMLLTPQRNGEYLVTDPNIKWQKVADRVCLAVHTSFKMVKGLVKFGFVELGCMAKNVIGKLPIFNLIMDSAIIASSFFSSWDTLGNSLPDAKAKLALAEAKLDALDHLPTAIALLEVGDNETRLDFLEKYAVEEKELIAAINKKKAKIEINNGAMQELKINGLKAQAARGKFANLAEIPDVADVKLSPSDQKKANAIALENKKLMAEISKADPKIQKIAGRISKIANQDIRKNNCLALAEELKASVIANTITRADGTIENYKMKKWTIYKANAEIEGGKIWFALANSIGKIAVVTFALTLTALNLWTLPFALSLLAMGIIVDSIGYGKLVYNEFVKPSAVPAKLKVAPTVSTAAFV